MTARSLLLILRRAPYGGSSGRAGLDLAMAAAAFEQPVSLLFMDDGVWQLQPGQDPIGIGAKSTEKALAALPLYDIESLYVDSESLLQRGLSARELQGEAQSVTAEALPAFIAGFDRVLVF